MLTAGFSTIIALTLRPSNAASSPRQPAAHRSVASGGPAEASHDVETLLQRLNEARKARGLAGLVLDPRLCAIAERHGLDMVSRHYFGHNDLEGRSPFGRMAQAHYPFGYAGENLALDRDVEAAHADLFASPEHRENMLEPHFVHVGIAAVPASDGEIVVEDFTD